MNPIQYDQTDAIGSIWPDDLRNGIWPRSVAVWMVGFYVLLFVIRPWEKLFPELVVIHFERSYAYLMIAVVLLSGRLRFRLDFQTFTVILFTGALYVSGLFVRGFSVPYVFVTLVVFYLMLVSVIRTPYELLFIVICYITAMGLYLGKSQWEFFLHDAGSTEMGVNRLQGIELSFGNDNALAASVVYSLPFWYLLFVVRKELCKTWPLFWSKWFARGLVVYSGLAVTSIFLTQSRMGALGLVAFLILLVMRRKNFVGKLTGLVTIGVVCLCTYFVLPSDMQGRLQTIWDPDSGSASVKASADGRWEGLSAGMEMFQDYPFFGVGLDNWTIYSKTHSDFSHRNEKSLESSDAHNLEGALFGETGIVGVISFVLLLSAIMLNCRKIRRLAAGQSDSEFAVLEQIARACRDGLILLLFLGQFSYNIQRFNWLWIAAFCSLAAMFAFRRNAEVNISRNRISA